MRDRIDMLSLHDRRDEEKNDIARIEDILSRQILYMKNDQDDLRDQDGSID